jgi:hypothetical protein
LLVKVTSTFVCSGLSSKSKKGKLDLVVIPLAGLSTLFLWQGQGQGQVSGVTHDSWELSALCHLRSCCVHKPEAVQTRLNNASSPVTWNRWHTVTVIPVLDNVWEMQCYLISVP